jgi:hypothetical protein
MQCIFYEVGIELLNNVVCRLKARIFERASIARQRLLKHVAGQQAGINHFWATLDKHVLKAGSEQSEKHNRKVRC